MCHLSTRNSICVISRQRCAARVNIPATYFLHFPTRNTRTPNLFCVNILKDKPSHRQNTQLRASRSMYFYLLAYQSKKFLKNGKIRMLGGKRNEGFKDKKRGGDRKSWIKLTAIIVSSLEQVHEKQNLETPEMAKKPLLRQPSNVQPVSNLYRSTKALLWKGAGMIIFSWINAQNILFQLPNLKNYIVWGSKWFLHSRW